MLAENSFFVLAISRTGPEMGAGCRHRLQSSPSPRLTPGSYFSSHAILTSTMIHDLITAFLVALGAVAAFTRIWDLF